MIDPILGEPEFSRRSYSQSGEDIIVAYIFHSLGIKNIKYLDIGAYAPKSLSNTFYFYERGFSGLCVEANPLLANAIAKERPRDITLNFAISSGEDGFLPFYIMSAPTLSTLSLLEAERLQAEEGVFIESTENVKVLSINSLIKQYFPEKDLNFISLDVEGMDYLIMQSFDFAFIRPLVFCLETLEYKKHGEQRKIEKLINLMTENGYLLYADTQINSIFVDAKFWVSR
ncbi:FkbM family methyltransferase [Polynucleobacter paneuropaeus]|nr:FkbM family methyltransferase [Polynucleobacter paneuropaeus]